MPHLLLGLYKKYLFWIATSICVLKFSSFILVICCMTFVIFLAYYCSAPLFYTSLEIKWMIQLFVVAILTNLSGFFLKNKWSKISYSDLKDLVEEISKHFKIGFFTRIKSVENVQIIATYSGFIFSCNKSHMVKNSTFLLTNAVFKVTKPTCTLPYYPLPYQPYQFVFLFWIY